MARITGFAFRADRFKNGEDDAVTNRLARIVGRHQAHVVRIPRGSVAGELPTPVIPMLGAYAGKVLFSEILDGWVLESGTARGKPSNTD